MVHYYLLLAHWISLWYTTAPIGPLAILMVHYTFLLTHWLSLWYTTIFYWSLWYTTLSCWPTRYLYCTLLSSTGPLDISLVQYPLLLAIIMVHSYLSSGPLEISMVHPSPIDPLAISSVHSYLLLAHWISLWYTPHPYCPNGYLYGILPTPIGPLAIPMVHYYLLLAHLISI